MMKMISFEQTEEHSLILRAKNGDTYAEEKVLMMLRPMILSFVGRLHCRQSSRNELIQAGSAGVFLALRHYDPARKARFSTYAYSWILGEMRRTLKLLECNRVSLDEQDTEKRALSDAIAGDGGIDIGHIDLKNAIRNLAQDEQVLIILRYFREKTQKETAGILGKSQAQISRMERHALDVLHALLSD